MDFYQYKKVNWHYVLHEYKVIDETVRSYVLQLVLVDGEVVSWPVKAYVSKRRKSTIFFGTKEEAITGKISYLVRRIQRLRLKETIISLALDEAKLIKVPEQEQGRFYRYTILLNKDKSFKRIQLCVYNGEDKSSRRIKPVVIVEKEFKRSGFRVASPQKALAYFLRIQYDVLNRYKHRRIAAEDNLAEFRNLKRNDG